MGKRNEDINIRVNAQDKTKGVLGDIKDQIIGIGAAYAAWRIGKDVIGDSIKKAAVYEATITSLHAVVKATGRDINSVYAEMETHLGSLASKAQVAEGFLKGMTTTLTVKQISNLTTAVKNASLAMGEDFGQQLPLIIKAVKQLNPAILDNIGVTVRLDQVNKRIRDGFYGVGTAIDETTQQHAIYQEIMEQTLQYQGQEEERLKTLLGAQQKLAAAYEDWQITVFQQGKGSEETLNWLSNLVRLMTFSAENTDRLTTAFENLQAAKAALAAGEIDITFGLPPALPDVPVPPTPEEIEYEAQVEAYRVFLEKKAADLDHFVRLAIAYEEELEDETEAIGERMWGEALQRGRDQIEAYSLHRDTLAEIRQLGWEAEYIGMTEHDAAMLELERMHEEELNIIAQDALLTKEELLRAEQALEIIYANERKKQHDKTLDELTKMYMQRWQFIANGVTKITRTFATTLVTDTKKMGEAMKQVFEQVGRAIVAYIAEAAVNAIFKYIAAQVAQRAMDVKELAMVKTKTAHYIALAAAKSAASLGTTTAASIAGAAATKAALMPMLMGPLGFDDPINDALARQHGIDYADHFMAGLATRWDAPQFGRDVRDTVPIGGDTGGSTTNITIEIQGNVIGEDDWVSNNLAPAIERAVQSGRSRLAIEDDNLTGRLEIGFV